MRINIYSQEQTSEVEIVETTTDEGITYYGARLFFHSSNKLHHREGDNDRSAATFWLPASEQRREEMARTFERITGIYRSAPPESGLD